MTSELNDGTTAGAPRKARNRTVQVRLIGAAVLVVLLVLFVVLNRQTTKISFIFFSAQSAVWVALAIAAAVGFVAGFFVSRSRYRD